MPVAALIVALAIMLAEQQRSRHNEQGLRARGAVEPTGDVYRMMAWAYPGAFVLMAVEGALASAGAEPGVVTSVVTNGVTSVVTNGGTSLATGTAWFALAGVVTFVAAKALKYWAIASLGSRWTFRVLVIPGAPLVAHGPYAALRHPNYIAVVGEMVGFALLVRAPLTGVISIMGFGLLLLRRIAVEERALRT